MSRLVSAMYKLWQSITWKSQLSLSKNLYYISYSLNQLLKHSNNKLENLVSHQKQESDSHQASQIDNIRKQNIIKVAIVDNHAFWVQNNKFWTSGIVDGYIDDMGAKEIDAHSLSNKELYMLLEILDELNS